MKQFLFYPAIIAFPLLLSGCVAVWGGAYKVDSQTPEAIVVQYDSNFIDDSEIEKLASDHCKNYNKKALLQAHDKNMLNLSTDNFLCQPVIPDALPAPAPAAAPQ